MNQRHLAKTSRWRRFSGIAIFLFLALIGWKIWFTRVEKRIIRLEKVVWFENLGTFPEEIKTLRGIRFSLLPPRLQARRCGLLGDWRLSQGDESRATALYEFEALLNVGINSSWLDVVDLAHHPNSARKAILDRIHDEQIEFSIPDDRIDTSCLTSRLLPLPDEENAYFALANLPPFRDQVIIKEKIDPFTFSANEIETAREYLAKNRDVLAKWDAVIDSFSKMRNPADAAFVRLDLAMKTHFCRFRIALADGDESGACESLSRIYRTLNILESDGMLVYSLVAVAMRGKMCITLKSLQIPASVRSRMAGIIRLHPADSNVLSRIAPREFMTIYQTISEDRELWGEEALKVGENEDRFIWEFEKALFSRWRELDEILTGQRKGPYEIPRAETLALKSFRNWRRGMYWREPHAQISGPREAKTLMTEETLRLSAEIVALVSIPRTGALFETFLKSKEEERKLIDHW